MVSLVLVWVLWLSLVSCFSSLLWLVWKVVMLVGFLLFRWVLLVSSRCRLVRVW